MNKKKEKINIVTLGCSKNIVDSEQLMHQLSVNNFEIVHNSNSFNYKTVIINTCGFINDAKQESIETILQFVDAKGKGKINRIFIMGCLSERYKHDLEKEFPEVDGIFGINEFERILNNLNAEIFDRQLNNRFLTTPHHFAYLKIAEGCDRNCAFCAIPLIKGNYHSKSIEDIVNEARILVQKGVKELILISQESTYYGIDLYKKQSLTELLTELAKIEELEWIRLQYTYPAKFPLEVIELMKKNPKICNYLDIPFQHISDKMLNLMKRGISKKETYQLITDIRKINPLIGIRTTLLVGHPGETEADFNELVDFVKQIKFERLGVFKYSHEEGTYAHDKYKDEVDEEVKEQRAKRILEIQQEISNNLNYNKIGKLFKVLIDNKEGDNYIGRTEFDSPEVDGEVIITEYPGNIKIGNFYQVRVTDANEYDLYGKVIK